MNTGWRRIVSGTVAILIAMSATLVCAPTTSVAEGHCKPARMEKAGCSHCPQKKAMDCCATSPLQPGSIPQDAQQQQQNTRDSASTTLSHADAVVVLAAIQPPGVARTLRASPVHGYRSTDLPTLHAVFLI